MKIYWQGRIQETRNAKVPVFGKYLDGTAIIESMHVKAFRIQHLLLHTQRLSEGAKVLMMPSPDIQQFEAAARSLIKVNHLASGSLRCRYFRDGSLLMHPLPPRVFPKAGIRLFTTAVRHYGQEAIQGRLKSNSVLPSLLARWEIQAWAEDGLRLTPGGYIAEGVWTNIIIQKNGVMISPPLTEGILDGTTRAIAFKKWSEKGGKVKEQPLTRYDLYTADKVWVCSSLRGLMKVREVDGREIGS